MNKKSFYKIIGLVLLIVVVVYIVCCSLLSISLFNTIRTVYSSQSYNDLDTGLYMDEKMYEQLNIKRHYSETLKNYENYKLDFSLPLVLFGVSKSKVYYNYSYLVYGNEDTPMLGCDGVNAVVTIELKGGKFTITNYFEEA